ncbi:MAG: POTRA domain-containing protein [Acidobacteriota bacterium]
MLAALLGIAAATPAPARAQAKIEEYLGRPVTTVRVQIEERTDTSEQLRALVDVKTGQPLTLEDIKGTVTHFMSLGRFEDVRVLANPAPDGVEITFRLIPVHPIEAVQFTGETGLPPAEMERLLRQRYGGLPVRERSSDIEAVVRDILADEGFLSAAVTAETVPSHQPERATLLILVQAGQRAVIRNVNVSGTSPFQASDLTRRVGVGPGLPYRQRAIQTALAKVRDDLRSQDYYAAVATHTFRAVESSNEIDVTLFVDAGPRIRIAVQPPGAASLTDASRLIKLEGSVDQDLLDDTDESILSKLRQEGYKNAKVSHGVQDQDGARNITFTVDRGPRYRIAAIDWPETLLLPRQTIDKLMGVREGELFDVSRVFAGLSRILVEYNRLGFYRAEFKPAYEETSTRTAGEAGIIVHPNLVEGPKGTVKDVRLTFVSGPRVPEADARAVIRSRPGQPFVSTVIRSDLQALQDLYADRGFRTAEIQYKAQLSEDGRDAVLEFSINEGPQILVGEITVIGNNRILLPAIMDEITLKSGNPLSPAKVEESANNLRRMGVFSRVRIQEEPRLPGETVANLVIVVEEAPATTIGGGGGLEVRSLPRQTVSGTFEDYLDFSPRAFFEIGRRSLGGRNRSINFFSRASINAPSDQPPDQRGGLELGEYRVTGTYRERRAFHSDTDLLGGITLEKGRRATFDFVRQALNGDGLRRLSPTVTLFGRYSLEFTDLLNEKILPADRPLIDKNFPQVRLSILGTGILRDRRDSPITPTRGTLIGADVEFALEAIGSEVGYGKVFVQASRFQTLTANQRHVLALRAQLGMAHGFERLVDVIGDDGQPVLGPDGQPLQEPTTDLPASQRFYSGGSTSVRGFQLDRLGVPEIITPDGLSLGGSGLVVLNSEVRTRVWSDDARRVPFVDTLGVVGFLDAGNVFRNASDIRLQDLRAAAGFGVRIGSALGPIRLDFGWQLTPHIPGQKGWEYHLSIGEAF